MANEKTTKTEKEERVRVFVPNTYAQAESCVVASGQAQQGTRRESQEAYRKLQIK